MKARVTLSGLLLLWTLNTLDAASTHLALYLKVGTELNPLMAWAFAVSPLIFWVVKFSLVSLSTVILYRFRKERIAGPALEIMNLAFAILIGWHLISWTLYFTSVLIRYRSNMETSNKKIFVSFLVALMLVALFGFVAPALISSKTDAGPFLGFGLLIVLAIYTVILVKKTFKL